MAALMAFVTGEQYSLFKNVLRATKKVLFDIICLTFVWRQNAILIIFQKVNNIVTEEK